MERRHWSARAPKTGDPAPASTLLDEAGKPVSLGQVAGGRPLVLLFVRSHEDEEGLRQLLDYRDATLAFKQAGARVAAVSTAEPSLLSFFRRERGIPFPLLSDEGGRMAQAWGLLDDQAQERLALAATFVVDADLVVRQRSLDAPGKRATAQSMLRFVKRGGAVRASPAGGLPARLRQLAQSIQHAFKPPRLVR